ncbi:T9SS type A sorting domain-containing protein [Hymenobacter sp. IS2118]|uniref:T9SS type A sorting domain-containing protein n=1 Tax=Hymenobacter sp. IS2118 TaxID=1505605 RepID=UPI0013785B43|nr:T9SS type A sorting domain-containing protein [Hymenobacter sp. IS2118]
MNNLTFTQKLLRQRFFFNCLIPLLALFVGVGSAQAQNVAIAVGTNVTLNVKGTTSAYNTRGTNGNTFVNNDFGSFNVNSDVFTLNATTLRLDETAATALNAFLLIRVFQGNLSTASTANSPAFTVIALQDGGTVNGAHQFTLSSASINLLSSVVGSAAGTSYRFDLRYRVFQGNGTTYNSPIRNSVFTAVTPPFVPSSATLRNVIVTSGTTAANATTNTYDANTSAAGPGVFNGTDFGPLNLSSSRLLLRGGAIEIQERNGDSFNQAQISYVVSPGTLATAGAAFPQGQNLPLTEVSYNAATMTRRFALSNAARNILSLATTGGSPGTSYRFDVSVSATGTNFDSDPITLSGQRQRSVFTATGVPIFQPTLNNTTVLVAANGGSNVSYDGSNVSANPDFAGANLGTFDVNEGLLVLNGGTATTVANGPNMVDDVTLYFRVRRNGTGGGGFSSLPLVQTSLNTDGNGTRTRTFELSNAARNLLAAVTATGDYRVDVYLQASGVNEDVEAEGMDGTFLVTSPTYIANFTVNGTPVVTTVWTGGLDDNWFDALNWTNGVPTATSNAIIPNFPSGNTRPYPNIYSDVVKPPTAQSTSTNPDGTQDVIPATPGYDNRGSGNAMVRNLTLQGTSQGNRSITRLIRGRLDVFGDFDNPQGSFIQRETTVISFKSQGNQTISGSINGFTDVEIDGGANSIKTLTGSFKVKAGGSLRFINGILQTNISLVSSNFVDFEGASTDPTTLVIVPAAQLLGETETSWLRGFITTTQPAALNTPQNFSNIGLTLTFTENEPGNTTVTRNTVENRPETAFAGSTLNPNSDPRPSIRRIFGVQPANPATQGRRLRANIAFRYLDNELVNLRRFDDPNNPNFNSTTSLDESKLSLYVSSTGGNTFNQLGRDSNTGNVLTKANITTFATFTLSEAAVLPPLPVTLTKFDVQRTGTDALVTWATASEINSKGFSVQVSKDGKEFRTLGFVASVAPNSSRLTNYSFTDNEKNKAGLRYYRLEQVDIDGTLAYNTPKVVSFEGAFNQTGVAFAYPNPYINEVSLSLKSSTDGKALVNITDMTGRTVGQRTIALATGTNEVEVKDLANLKSGLYLMRVTMPSGEVKNVKVVKQ